MAKRSGFKALKAFLVDKNKKIKKNKNNDKKKIETNVKKILS